MTNVVVGNGSARMEKWYTSIVLNAFLEGMEEAGAQIELLCAKKLNVNPCTGEFYCWSEKISEYYQQDAM